MVLTSVNDHHAGELFAVHSSFGGSLILRVSVLISVKILFFCANFSVDTHTLDVRDGRAPGLLFPFSPCLPRPPGRLEALPYFGCGFAVP
jgi:hypothetical protein